MTLSTHRITIGLILIAGLWSAQAWAASYSSVAAGNWNSTSTWSCGCIPASTDDVTINHDVTVTADANIAGIVLRTGTLLLNGGNLNITNDLEMTDNGAPHPALQVNTAQTLTISGDFNPIKGNVYLYGDVNASTFTVDGNSGLNFNVYSSSTTTITNAAAISSGPHSFNVEGVFAMGFLTMSGSTHTMQVNGLGSLNVTNDVSIAGSAIIDINSSLAAVNVGGNYTSSGGASTQVDGMLSVGGTLTLISYTPITDPAGNGEGKISAGILDCDNDGTGETISECGNISGFSDSDIFLPVSLTRFEGSIDDNGIVNLQWSTGFEKDNLGFEVEKAWEGEGFEKVGYVSSKVGNANSVTEYDWKDHSPTVIDEQGVYYRLKQLDANGDHHYSKVVFIRHQASADAQVNLYPNPVLSGQEIHIQSGNHIAQVSMYDAKGQLIAQSQELTIKAPTSSGIVYLDIELEQGMHLRKKVALQ